MAMATAPQADDPMTLVDLLFVDGVQVDRLRFGTPVRIENIDHHQGRAWMRPGTCFGYIRWRADAYGTQSWRCFVGLAGRPGDALTRLPGVYPGAHLLVNLSGKTYVKRFLMRLDELQKSVDGLSGVSPAYWRKMQMRAQLNLPVNTVGETHAMVHSVRRRLI